MLLYHKWIQEAVAKRICKQSRHGIHWHIVHVNNCYENKSESILEKVNDSLGYFEIGTNNTANTKPDLVVNRKSCLRVNGRDCASRTYNLNKREQKTEKQMKF